MKAKWRVYYSDGAMQDSNSELPFEPYGVVAILQLRSHDGRHHITSGSPYYIHDGEEWLPCWINDIEDYLAHKIPIHKFLIGRIVSKRVFTEIFERAKRDRANEALD